MHRKLVAFSLAMIWCVAAGAQMQRLQHLKEPVAFPLTLHVKSSYIAWAGNMTGLTLLVVVDGKNFQLADFSHTGLLAILPPGDYRARVSGEQVKKGGLFTRSYELQYSDGARESFNVIGESE